MFKWKIIQFDVSRGRVPTIETIKRRIDLLLPYGLNGVLLYMECVVENSVFPAVGCGGTPLKKEHIKELDSYCLANGVALIPLFQTLAHQERLLSRDDCQQYGELPPPRNTKGSNNFLFWQHETRRKITAWLDELVPLFTSSPYLHLGWDEAWSIGEGRSTEMVAAHGVEHLLGEYVTFLDHYARGKGKQAMIYGDLAVDFPSLLPMIPKTVTIVNWNYGLMDESYEVENHHFAAHPALHAQGHAVWGSGNNMAEYVFTPFHRLEGNASIWLDLCASHGDEGFIISDWGCDFSFLLSILGDQYLLMRIADKTLSLERFVEEFSRLVLTAPDARFVDAMSILLRIQEPQRYFHPAIKQFGPVLRSFLFDDPRRGGVLARCFGCVPREGLELLCSDARRALEMLTVIDPVKARQPDLLRDCVKLAERLLLTAVRANLWHEYAWDPGYPGPLPERDRRRAPLLKEYLSLWDANKAWSQARWLTDNLESELARELEMLDDARRVTIELFPWSKV